MNEGIRQQQRFAPRMYFLKRLLDALIAVPIAVGLGAFVAAHFCIFHLPRRFRKQDRPHPNRLVSLIASRLEDNIRKGEMRLIEDWDMKGYFQPYINIHFPSPNRVDTMLTPNNRYIEIPMSGRTWFESGWKLTVMCLNEFHFLHRISALIRRDHVSVVISQTPFLEGINAWLLHVMTGCPNLLASHCNYDIEYKTTGLPKHLGNFRLAKAIEVLSYRLARVIYPARESQMRYILKYYNHPEKMKVRHNAINLDLWKNAPDPAMLDRYGLRGKKVVLFAGRLSPYNYVYDIVLMAEIVTKQYPDAAFLLLGEEAAGSGVRSRLEAMIAEKKLEDLVLLPGFVPNADLIHYRKLSTVNLVTMGGVSLIEAAASGVPCVCYDIDWHWEVIEHEKGGILVPESDIAKAAESIMHLFAHPEIGLEMARNSMAKVKSQNTIEIEQAHKIKLYEELFSSYYAG